MRLTFDDEVSAIYLEVEAKPSARTVRESAVVMVDLGEDGELVGIELLDPRKLSEVPALLARHGVSVPSRLDYVRLAEALAPAEGPSTSA